MTKYHINAKGVPAPCRAKKGNCPFGGDDSHFDNIQDAHNFADKQNEKEFGLIPKGKLKSMTLKNFKTSILNGESVKLGEDLYYKVIKMNSEEAEMNETLKSQLKEDGLYDNSYVGVVYLKSDLKEGPSGKPQISQEVLPIRGSVRRYVTKHLKSNKEKALNADLNDKDLGILEKAIKFREKEIEEQH